MTEHHWWQHDLDVEDDDYCFCGELVVNCERPRWLQTLDTLQFTPVKGWSVVGEVGRARAVGMGVDGIAFDTVEDAQAYVERKYREAREWAHHIPEGVRL